MRNMCLALAASAASSERFDPISLDFKQTRVTPSPDFLCHKAGSEGSKPSRLT